MLELSKVAVAVAKTSARLMTLAPAQADTIATAAEVLLTDLQEAAKGNAQAARIAAPKQSGAPDHDKSGKVRIVQGLGEENAAPKIGDDYDPTVGDVVNGLTPTP